MAKLNDNHLISSLLLDQIQTTCEWSGMILNREDLSVLIQVGDEIEKYFINYICRKNGRRVLRISNKRKQISENFFPYISICMFCINKFPIANNGRTNPFNGILSLMPDKLPIDLKI